MRNPQRVVWSEGLLMTPQHLQQLDAYHECLTHARFDALEPFGWGVVRCTLDSAALRSDQVALESFQGVLPDGTPLIIDPSQAERPPARPVEGHFGPSQRTLDVHLGLLKEREGITNVGTQKGGRTRFLRASRGVGDMTGSASHQEIAFAERNPVILFGGEPRDDYETIKIAELVRDDAGVLTVSEPYIPPCLRVSAAPFLISGIRRLLTTMQSRRAALMEARREREDASIEFHAGDITRFLLLNAVNTYLPLLKHLVDAGDLPPRNAYLLLAQLAGQLTTFSGQGDPMQVPKFLYTDLRSTFEPLIAMVLSLLHQTIREQYVSVTLEGRREGMFLGQLSDPRFGDSRRFFLAVRSPLAEREVAETLPRLCKIASWQDIHGILAAATPGAPVQVTFRPPPQIPVKAGVTYFAVATDNPYWSNVLLERKVSVYLPSPFRREETEVQLLAIPE